MYRLTRIQIVVVGLSLLIAATLSMSNNTVLHAISHYIYINTILAIIAISISLLLKKYQTNLYGEQQYHSYIERLVEGLGGPDPTSATSMPILMDFYQHELRQVINNRPNDQ